MVNIQAEYEKEREMYLDKPCHDKFLSFMMLAIEQMLLIKEPNGNPVSSLCLNLVYFDTAIMLPFLLNKIYEVFDRQNMSFNTVTRVLIYIAKPLLSRFVFIIHN